MRPQIQDNKRSFVTRLTHARCPLVTLQIFPKPLSNFKIVHVKHRLSFMKTGGQTSRQRLGGGWRRINLGTRFAALWRPTSILQRMFTTSLAFLFSVCAWANPHGMTVTRGSATLTQTGSQLNVQVSRGAVLDWRSFNIQRGETTTFIQPSSTSVVWNRILDPNLSQVWGTMNANGWVVLMNQNGFYFGPNSVINVRGLMVTTVPVASDASAGGGMWQFNGTPPLASIINYGEIKAHSGGSVFLVSERVENHGSISAPGGTIGLYAGKEVLVSERPDGRGLSATVKLPAGSVDNHGQLIADAGTIALHAQVVNQNGVIQANSVREHH